MGSSYIDLIQFCAVLTIPQLIAYRNSYKKKKNREYLIACEVLKIRLKKKTK